MPNKLVTLEGRYVQDRINVQSDIDHPSVCGLCGSMVKDNPYMLEGLSEYQAMNNTYVPLQYLQNQLSGGLAYDSLGWGFSSITKVIQRVAQPVTKVVKKGVKTAYRINKNILDRAIQTGMKVISDPSAAAEAYATDDPSLLAQYAAGSGGTTTKGVTVRTGAGSQKKLSSGNKDMLMYAGIGAVALVAVMLIMNQGKNKK